MVYADNFRRIDTRNLFRPNGELEGSHQGIFRPRSGDPAFLSKPSDLAPEVIGFGLIPAGDPNGPLIRAQDDLDQRPRPERCIEALPPPADAVRGDRGAQAPSSRTDRRWQRRDYGGAIRGRRRRRLFETGVARVLRGPHRLTSRRSVLGT